MDTQLEEHLVIVNVTPAFHSVCRFVIERVVILTVYLIVTGGTGLVAAAVTCKHRTQQLITSSVMTLPIDLKI